MRWADGSAVRIETVLDPDDQIRIVVTAEQQSLTVSAARRLAAALLNAADQLDEFYPID